jgi:transcription termination factor Rho
MSPRPRKTPEPAAAESVAVSPAPKRRGRPPKALAAAEAPAAVVDPGVAEPAAAGGDGTPPTPKRRGRPPKAAAVALPTPPERDRPTVAPRAGAPRADRDDDEARGERSVMAGLGGDGSVPDRSGRFEGGRSDGAAPAGRGERGVREERGSERDHGDRDDARFDREDRAAANDDGGSAARDDADDGDDRDERGVRDDGTAREDRGDRSGRRGRRGGGARRGGFNFRDLQGKILPELHLLAKEVGLDEYRVMEKDDLVLAILERVAEGEGLRVVQGYLEISSDGYGFLQESLLQHNTRSVIVSAGLIKQFRLRTGDMILGKARRPRDNERYGTLIRVEAVNGIDPFQASKRPKFDDLIPTFPDHRITLETGQQDLSARVIDLLAPIGRGQRGLIVAPPKAGKTTLLKAIAKSVVTNEPDIKVIVLLVDERPEEVTDFRESVTGVEVIASTFDEPPANHIRVAEFVHERARRIVEDGGHAMILLDSITRLARANNLVTPATGRTLSGGLDSNALHWPKRFLGAARNIRGGGSLSILATALVETGSRMDDVIFEEFKGTGNMELHLSRRLEERRIFPAIDILKSGTRREDLLLKEGVLAKMWLLRKVISDMDAAEAMEMLLSRLQRTKDNTEFLSTLGQG